MYGCESWSIKTAEHQRIDAFELWCWRRLLRVPERRSNQSILKETSPEYSLEELVLKLKLQNFGHVIRRTDSSKKTLMLGKTEGRRAQERMRQLDGWLNWVIEQVHLRHMCHQQASFRNIDHEPSVLWQLPSGPLIYWKQLVLLTSLEDQMKETSS